MRERRRWDLLRVIWRRWVGRDSRMYVREILFFPSASFLPSKVPSSNLRSLVSLSKQALKLAERMLAFADSRLLVAEAHLARARAIDSDTSDQAEYNIQDVLAAYLKAVEAHPEEVMAQLGVGSCFVRTGALSVHSFSLLLRGR